MNTRNLNRGLRVCLLALLFVATGSVAEIPDERREALDAAQAGTVSIHVRGPVNANSQYRDSNGTGFIVARYKNRAIIATNCHVACNKTWIWVTTFDNQKVRVHARFITGDRRQDIALISIPAFDGMEILPLMDGVPEQGEQAVAIGSPMNVRWSVTAGIFSVLNRTDINYPTPNGVHQTDAAINPGNSGGPLLVYRPGGFQVAGMNTFIVTGQSRTNTGISFAVPSSDIQRVLKAYLSGQPSNLNTIGGVFHAVKDLLGELMQVPTNYREAGVNGIYVTQLREGGPLDAAGIQEGDVLLEINGTKLRNLEVFKRVVHEAEPFLPMAVTYLRDGALHQTHVYVENAWGKGVERNTRLEQAGNSNQSQAAGSSDPLSAFGFVVMDNTTPRYRNLLGPQHPETSPMVMRIRNGSAAHYNGVQANLFLKAIGFEGMPPERVDTRADIKALFEKAEANGVDTSRAVFIFKAYQVRGNRLYGSTLPPIALDINDVPPPA